jgi:hypothetical protein
MATNTATTDDTARRRLRLRFSLKALLILVTLACGWLGLRIARERRAESLAARTDALRVTIKTNCDLTPEATRLIRKTGLPVLTADTPVSKRTWKSDLLLAGEELCTVIVPKLELDVSEALETESVASLGNRLVRHYEAGLAELGLRRVPNWAVWVSDRANVDTTVYIQVQVDREIKAARVQILCVDRTSTSLW